MTRDWSINALADETGMDRRTIKKILQDVPPSDIVAENPVYRLKDFIDAIVLRERGGGEGELEKERIRKTRAEADILEVERARVRNEVIEVDVALHVIENRDVAIRRIIITSKLSKEEQDSILHELQSINIEALLEQREFDSGIATEVAAEL